MITQLFIDGFKSLRNVKLAPKALNVLVGPNGSGKSSVLQALLLLRQSAEGDLIEFIAPIRRTMRGGELLSMLYIQRQTTQSKST